MTIYIPRKISYDFYLPKVIQNAVNIIKEKSDPYFSLFQTKKSNIKNPCGICQKSVNKNQHAIYCTVCLRWTHRKCNGTSVKEYEYLTEEYDDIPRQCLLCDSDQMVSKFPCSHILKIELNEMNYSITDNRFHFRAFEISVIIIYSS